MAITDPGSRAGLNHSGHKPLWKKWAWFAGLWAGGVLAVSAVGFLIRWWLHP